LDAPAGKRKALGEIILSILGEAMERTQKEMGSIGLVSNLYNNSHGHDLYSLATQKGAYFMLLFPSQAFIGSVFLGS